MNLTQAMGVIVGADIGTTLTVQLIAFKVFDYALLLIGVGFLLRVLPKRRLIQYFGQALMGFGFIFFSIKIMADAMVPLRTNPIFTALIADLGDRPLLGILIAALFSAIVQSSAATIGLALTLALQGVMPLAAALPIIFGANIGTCATAVASSIGTSVEAKRVAMAHTLFKVLGVLFFLPFLDPFARLVALTSADVPRQIANAHTLFNVILALLFLPFMSLGVRVLQLLVPDAPEAEGVFRPRYLDEKILETPAMALSQATREALRMGDIVSEMLRRSIETFERPDLDKIEAIEQRDDQVDLLDREIKHYLTKLSQQNLTEEQSHRELTILSFINNMENIGDIIDRNLMEKAKEKLYKGVNFSEKGHREIIELHLRICENLDRGIAAFASHDATLARGILDQKPQISQLERTFRQNHIQRLRDGYRETIDTSEIHLDVLTNLKRINSHITAIAYPILGT
jgi:phosphate:Na+ symporter